MSHRSRLRSILSDEDLQKVNNYYRDDDDYFDDFDSDDEELPVWACTGCGWVGNDRPMGGECPRCMCAVEEEYL